MGRTMAIVFTTMLCLAGLGGCGMAQPLPQEDPALVDFSGNFSAGLEIAYGDMALEAAISRSPQSCTMKFTSPASLEGMEVLFSQDDIQLLYKSLSFTFDSSAMPAGAIAKMIHSSLAALLREESLTASYSDTGLLLISGYMDSGGFTAEMDPETGHLLKLSVPGQELEISFRDFAFLD